jgi:hypothetical protein
MHSFIFFSPYSPHIVRMLRMSGAVPPFLMSSRYAQNTRTCTSTSDEALPCFGEYPVSDSLYRRLFWLIRDKTLLAAFKKFTLHFGREKSDHCNASLRILPTDCVDQYSSCVRPLLKIQRVDKRRLCNTSI